MVFCLIGNGLRRNWKYFVLPEALEILSVVPSPVSKQLSIPSFPHRCIKKSGVFTSLCIDPEGFHLFSSEKIWAVRSHNSFSGRFRRDFKCFWDQRYSNNKLNFWKRKKDMMNVHRQLFPSKFLLQLWKARNVVSLVQFKVVFVFSKFSKLLLVITWSVVVFGRGNTLCFKIKLTYHCFHPTDFRHFSDSSTVSLMLLHKIIWM